jgi:hypothetical protein
MTSLARAGRRDLKDRSDPRELLVRLVQRAQQAHRVRREHRASKVPMVQRVSKVHRAFRGLRALMAGSVLPVRPDLLVLKDLWDQLGPPEEQVHKVRLALRVLPVPRDRPASRARMEPSALRAR